MQNFLLWITSVLILTLGIALMVIGFSTRNRYKQELVIIRIADAVLLIEAFGILSITLSGI